MLEGKHVTMICRYAILSGLVTMVSKGLSMWQNYLYSKSLHPVLKSFKVCTLVPCLLFILSRIKTGSWCTCTIQGISLDTLCWRSDVMLSYEPRTKLNLGENMVSAQPVSGVIHEPQIMTSDLQANKVCSCFSCGYSIMRVLHCRF